MNTCKGCKHLISGTGGEFCTFGGGQSYHVNSFSGNREFFHIYANGLEVPPNVSYMLQKSAPCGPDRQEYSPTLTHRFVVWLGSLCAGVK